MGLFDLFRRKKVTEGENDDAAEDLLAEGQWRETEPAWVAEESEWTKTASSTKPSTEIEIAELPDEGSPASRNRKKKHRPTTLISSVINPALEQELRRDPNNTDVYLVYSQWLQQRGDPRGELIAVQHQLDRNKADPELLKASFDLLESYKDLLLGPLGDYPELLTVQWMRGFIKSARLHQEAGMPAPALVPEELLRTLLGHPSSRFLQELSIGRLPEDGARHYAAAITALSETGELPPLRHLRLGDFEQTDEELSRLQLPNLDSLWSQVSKLQHLSLRAGQIAVGSIFLPELRSLSLHAAVISKENLDHLVAAAWPKLERLVLRFGPLTQSPAADHEDLRPLLAAEHFPRLKHLVLQRCTFADDLCRELEPSKLITQLKSLELADSALTDQTLQHIAAHREVFSCLFHPQLLHNG